MSDTGKKYIPSGVFLKCNQGSIPGQLTVLPSQVTLYGEPWATDLDAKPMVNVMPFGICQLLSKSNPVPCVPATMMWQKALEGGLQVNGAKPLLETSELPCSVGGTIKIFFTRQAAMASISADQDHQHADTAKEASLWLFGAAVLAAVVVVGVTVATGGAALPLLAAAGAAAATGGAIGAGVGAVAGGIDGYAHGGAEGAAIGAAKGLFVGGIMGAVGGAALAVGGAVTGVAMGLSALAFGTAAAFDSKALLDEPNLENGLVVVADVVVLAGGLIGEKILKGPVTEVSPSRTPYKGFGGDIILDPNKTTTVLGKFEDPTNGYGTKEILNLPDGSFTRGGENKGGINILDIPTDQYEQLLADHGPVEGKEIFWEEHNQPFLEKSFQNGDNVRLLSDPDAPANRTGFYDRELQEIDGTTDAAGNHTPGLAEKYGYKYNPATSSYEKIP
jgi:hypothetical protein